MIRVKNSAGCGITEGGKGFAAESRQLCCQTEHIALAETWRGWNLMSFLSFHPAVHKKVSRSQFQTILTLILVFWWISSRADPLHVRMNVHHISYCLVSPYSHTAVSSGAEGGGHFTSRRRAEAAWPGRRPVCERCPGKDTWLQLQMPRPQSRGPLCHSPTPRTPVATRQGQTVKKRLLFLWSSFFCETKQIARLLEINTASLRRFTN